MSIPFPDAWERALRRVAAIGTFTVVAAAQVPAQLPLDLARMSAAANGDVAPLSGFAGTRAVTLAGDVARLRYEGPDGVLEYEWRRPQGSADGLYGAIVLTAQAPGAAAVTTSVGTGSSLSWSQAASAQSSTWEAGPEACTLVRTFAAGAVIATVRITGRLAGKSLALQVSCDQPIVTAFEAGTLTGPGSRNVTVPFYTGAVRYLPGQNLFAGVLLDWTASAATSHSATRALYQARTDGTRVPLGERAIFTAAWHLAEVFPNVPHPPSPWRTQLADKVVLDIWGGQFATIARNLEVLADHGVTNCVALIHVWQRSGYDNALPAHLPAQASLGGDAAMATLTATARRLGLRCALHENYVDYYPNYELFNPADVALNSVGGRVNAWFNQSTQIQSFAIQPNAVLRLAATQSPEIHRRFLTTAAFLDVNSAVAPWFHVDQRAGEEGAGTFARVREIHRQLFDYERATHEGPLFGEGHRHWFWGGQLDGVEAQFGAGWPINGGLTAPLLPDFDLLRIHPQMVNHGMGYYNRWYPEADEATFAGPPPLLYLDRYRMQEVAYGHAPFLATSTYANVPLAWLEHHLVSPVAARYGAARVAEVLYEGDGGAWIDASALAKRDQPLAQRVRVRYDNGLIVTANSAETPLAAGAWTLPPLGWLAEGAGVTAGTVLRQGIVCDFADTGDTFFANARSALDWNLSTFRDIRPSVADWQQTGPRALRVTYRWTVQDRLAKDYRCFVHFTSDNTIRWQQDHALTPPTSQWQVNQVVADGPFNLVIPATIPDGDYRWLIGLYDQAGTSERVRLRGADGGGNAILLGVLQVRDGGASLAFVPATGEGPDFSARDRPRLNEANTVIDFGPVRTDGSVRLPIGNWIFRGIGSGRGLAGCSGIGFQPMNLKNCGWKPQPLFAQKNFVRFPPGAVIVHATMNGDTELLRRYAEDRSEAAFAELVRRHLNLVYFAALRQVGGDTHRAQDVAQSVFTDLARKAASLTDRATLTGWLHTSTRFAATKARRADSSRQQHEHEATTMNALLHDSDPAAEWERLRPMIDDVIHELDDRDREAVLLRFFEGRPFADVGATLSLSEDAARMRVDRALDKLRAALSRRGVKSTSAALATVFANQVGATAPMGLATSITAAALVGAGAVSGVGLIATFMITNKATIAASIAAVLAITTAVYHSGKAQTDSTTLTRARGEFAALRAQLADLESRTRIAEQETRERQNAVEQRAPAAAPTDAESKAQDEALQRLLAADPQLRELRLKRDRMSNASYFGLERAGLTSAQLAAAGDLLERPMGIREAQRLAGLLANNDGGTMAKDFFRDFRTQFGEAAADRLAEFRKTRSGAFLVSELSAKLYYADAPLRQSQSDQLVQLIANSGDPVTASPGTETGSQNGFLNVVRRTRDWIAILARAETFLSPAQLQGLQALAARGRMEAQLADYHPAAIPAKK